MQNNSANGIKLITILSFLIGGLMLLASIIGILMGSLSSILNLIISCTLLISAYGLLTKNKWGHQLSLAVYALSIPHSIISIFKSGGLQQIVAIAIAGFIIWYLLKPEIKIQFS